MAIGEFLVLYSKLEAHLAKFISAKKRTAEVKNLRLNVSIGPNFDVLRKAKKLNDYIMFDENEKLQAIYPMWEGTYNQIIEIAEARNFLSHGTFLCFKYYDPIETFISTGKSKKMINRKFFLHDIENLTFMTHVVINKLSGDFWRYYAYILGYENYALTGIILNDPVTDKPIINVNLESF